MTTDSAAGGNSAENPWPVRSVSTKIADWVHRLGQVWVEGQLTQINRRSGTRTTFMTLRDPSADISLTITCDPQLLERASVPLTEGSRVVVLGKPSFYTGRGTLSLRVTDIRAVGIGELLARLERLRQLLHAEGLFDPRRKRPLPFLPKSIGLITARASAAERDVLAVAQSRWPAVHFTVRHAPVQGPTAVPTILGQLERLDADPDVEVIVLARGGGSVEDLLPFSDESLLRAVAAATTPVVSAIGHEPDQPLLDLVADLRAATPTDAAKRIVPDVAAELAQVTQLRARSAQALRNWVVREERALASLRDRPALADPLRMVNQRHDEIDRALADLHRDMRRLIDREDQRIEHLAAQLKSLGPAQTLARGYAVVQRIPGENADPEVVRSIDDMPIGSQLRIRVGDGATKAAVMGVEK